MKVFQSDIVNAHQPAPCTRFDRHVAEGHAALHSERLNGSSTEFDCVACPACSADLTDHRERDIFSSNSLAKHACHFNAKILHLALNKALRRQHVLNLRCADSMRQGTGSTMCGGMGITTDDSHPRQDRTLLWPHHMHNPLPRIIQRNLRDVKRFAIIIERL